MRVLVVEDEARLAASLRCGLEADGFADDVAFDGTDGLWMATENAYDAVVLDIMLPGVNGFQVCQPGLGVVLTVSLCPSPASPPSARPRRM